ncbi:MAG: hypothetical protein UU92_C0014G0001 [candidate division WWE3 bacterium GW2011_GWA1_42_12]|nr:MAG: hypothetical protein UU92_C0014G0001 [candidate division WWE3 bacterium GW2011_GWA1_42_12]
MIVLVACGGQDYQCYFDEIPRPESIIEGRELQNDALRARVNKEFGCMAVVKYCGLRCSLEFYPWRRNDKNRTAPD